MFDTSVVRAHALAGPRRATFAISLVLHSLAVVAAAVLTFASAQLPVDPPKQFELYRSTELPSQPPPPLGHPPQHQRQQRQQAIPTARTLVAPSTVAPETIPQQPATAASEPGPATGPITTETTGGDNGPIGSPFGVPGGVGEGETGTGPYTPGGLVSSAHVISRVEPRFPPAFVHSVRSAIVVVRCVIGQDGSIRDPEIVTSSFPPFNDAVLSALRQWKFAPGVMHGRPVDTWFELRVKFQVR